MRQLGTIQVREKLNEVYAVDNVGPGGANHEYKISPIGNPNTTLSVIKFQCGPRKQEDAVHGVIDTDLLEIVRDRLKAFQEGAFANEYSEAALNHIEDALILLNKRIEDRVERNVLGSYEK